MSYLFLFCCISLGTCIVAPGLPSLDEEWQEWKNVYNKMYSTPGEERERMVIWEENLDFIESHNNHISVTYKLAMNQFGDQRPGENRDLNVVVTSEDSTQELNDNTLEFAPSSFDWRTRGVITPVKNQGSMGSSDAIVVAECVESYHAINSGGQLLGLSVQEVQDCCSRGQPLPAPIVEDCFGCVRNHGGLCSDADYTSPTRKCNNESCTAVAQVAGTKLIPPGNEDMMVGSIQLVPLMVYVDASHPSFRLYASGVYQSSLCSKTSLDHALQLVGYGVLDDKLYWICKNSWGSEWGMKGYMFIRRGHNECGIATSAKYPF